MNDEKVKIKLSEMIRDAVEKRVPDGALTDIIRELVFNNSDEVIADTVRKHMPDIEDKERFVLTKDSDGKCAVWKYGLQDYLGLSPSGNWEVSSCPFHPFGLADDLTADFSDVKDRFPNLDTGQVKAGGMKVVEL